MNELARIEAFRIYLQDPMSIERYDQSRDRWDKLDIFSCDDKLL